MYKLNTMNIERNFERLGGYNHGGCMEQLGRQLNEGQARKERIKAEGERIFSNVTGPEHAEELYHFTHDLVDIGLKTRARFTPYRVMLASLMYPFVSLPSSRKSLIHRSS